MKQPPLNNCQIIEYLRKIKEDTAIEEHRTALDVVIADFEDKEPHDKAPVVIAKILYDNWGKVDIRSPCVDCNITIGMCPFDEMRDKFKYKDWNISLLVKDCKHFIIRRQENRHDTENKDR